MSLPRRGQNIVAVGSFDFIFHIFLFLYFLAFFLFFFFFFLIPNDQRISPIWSFHFDGEFVWMRWIWDFFLVSWEIFEIFVFSFFGRSIWVIWFMVSVLFEFYIFFIVLSWKVPWFYGMYTYRYIFLLFYFFIYFLIHNHHQPEISNNLIGTNHRFSYSILREILSNRQPTSSPTP